MLDIADVLGCVFGEFGIWFWGEKDGR